MENKEEILATVSEMLVAEEMYEAADLIRQSQCDFEISGHDNWNGGTDLFTLFVRLAVADFARLKPRKQALEKQIERGFKPS